MDFSLKTNPSMTDARNRPSKSSVMRVLGVGAVLSVTAIPVLFSDGVRPWNTNPAVSPFAAPVAVVTITDTLPAGGAANFTLEPLVLYNPSGSNRTRVDFSDTLTGTIPFSGPAQIDLSNGFVNQGTDVLALNGHCCLPENVFSPDGINIVTTSTGPGGILWWAEIDPSGVANLTRIDASATNQWTGIVEPVSGGWLAATSWVATNQTAVYTAPITNTSSWSPLLTVPSNTVSANQHPDMATDYESGSAYLLYPQGQSLKLRKFDPTNGSTVWEATEIVALDPAPNNSFDYYQIDVDGGKGVGLAPRDNDLIVFFTDQLDGPIPPSAVQFLTVTGDPPGDHHALWLDGYNSGFVEPDPDGIGTIIHHIQWNADPSVPPNLMEIEDNSFTSAWSNTPSTYLPIVIQRDQLDAVDVRSIRPNMVFVVQGDPVTNQVRYGVIDVPIHFDGFESGTTAFWNTVN